jgi:signal transduction histidine kinase
MALAGPRVRGSPGSDEVRIEISDEGPGVPPDERERIWRPYQRGSDVSGVAGSGVGLSVVADVVAQHAGRVWVEDGPAGRGACFVVTFPASRGAPVSSRTTSAATDADEFTGAVTAPAHSLTRAPARP